MRISEHVHSIRLPFQIRIGTDQTLDRFANVCWIEGKRLTLIDAGVAGSKQTIFDAIAKTERDPQDLARIVFTHAHPDHIGGAKSILEATNCELLAHHDDAPWIWDVDRQIRERPVPGFRSLVEGSVVLNRLLRDEERIELGDDGVLTVIHTPGHSKGHIALVYEPDGVLFSGDALPVPGQIPIYDDPLEAVRSVRRLQSLGRRGGGIRVLLSSWDKPRRGGAMDAAIQNGIQYLIRVHATVLKERAAGPEADIRTLTTRVLRALSLPEILATPLVFRAMEAHLRVGIHPELTGE